MPPNSSTTWPDRAALTSSYVPFALMLPPPYSSSTRASGEMCFATEAIWPAPKRIWVGLWYSKLFMPAIIRRVRHPCRRAATLEKSAPQADNACIRMPKETGMTQEHVVEPRDYLNAQVLDMHRALTALSEKMEM